MATNHVAKIKQRALDVITQPTNVAIKQHPVKTFVYPTVDPDLPPSKLRQVFDEIDRIAAKETAALIKRIMARD